MTACRAKRENGGLGEDPPESTMTYFRSFGPVREMVYLRMPSYAFDILRNVNLTLSFSLLKGTVICPLYSNYLWRFTSDSAPSEARKRGSGGGSPRKYDDLFTGASDLLERSCCGYLWLYVNF